MYFITSSIHLETDELAPSRNEALALLFILTYNYIKHCKIMNAVFLKILLFTFWKVFQSYILAVFFLPTFF